MKKAKLVVELFGAKCTSQYYGKCQTNIKVEYTFNYEKISDKLSHPKSNLKCVFADDKEHLFKITIDKEYTLGTYNKDGYGEDFSASFQINNTGYELEVYLDNGRVTSINLKEYDSLSDYFEGNDNYNTLELISYQYGRQKFNV